MGHTGGGTVRPLSARPFSSTFINNFSSSHQPLAIQAGRDGGSIKLMSCRWIIVVTFFTILPILHIFLIKVVEKISIVVAKTSKVAWPLSSLASNIHRTILKIN
jgi:hypothetical protein